MAYRMNWINSRVCVGQQSRGDFDIEIWSEDRKTREQEILLPRELAEDLAKELLKLS